MGQEQVQDLMDEVNQLKSDIRAAAMRVLKSFCNAVNSNIQGGKCSYIVFDDYGCLIVRVELEGLSPDSPLRFVERYVTAEFPDGTFATVFVPAISLSEITVIEYPYTKLHSLANAAHIASTVLSMTDLAAVEEIYRAVNKARALMKSIEEAEAERFRSLPAEVIWEDGDLQVVREPYYCTATRKAHITYVLVNKSTGARKKVATKEYTTADGRFLRKKFVRDLAHVAGGEERLAAILDDIFRAISEDEKKLRGQFRVLKVQILS